eukprot:gnl/TRDRNA2_/TRDRNA2_94863_c1_seq1.p1 gnl/TRDRNA2_/TRDRNA2_94863_c1~~gnl/TRDRNA2_/TRDRNA2_94863_c1_seq1.p1  ORF type:complete len:359 (+),score=45.12 gnl/TRDRNA2_/TRDRNA2_94863_c1_seq1:93-1079(+)
MNAHPKIDPVTGELFWMDYDVTGGSQFSYGVMSPDGKEVSRCGAKLAGGKGVMIHDCGITERHAIVIDCPVLVDIQFLEEDGSIWRYVPEHGARIGIFPRDVPSGKIDRAITWFDIKPCYIFHIANCWQDDEDTVVMIAVRWDDVQMGGGIGRRSPSNSNAHGLVVSAQHLWEWKFNLTTQAVSEQELTGSQIAHLEFPVVHPARVGRRCRWTWFVGEEPGDPLFHRVFKFDINEKCATSTAFVRHGQRLSSGECAFVPRTGSTAEDDGYLVTFVVDPAGLAASSFWVLDAQTMGGAPLAIVDLPVRVPMGFHGLWVTEEQLQSQRDI